MSIDKFKRTGRTTRMLEFAIEQAQKGKEVIVFSLGGEHMNRLVARLHELSPMPDSIQRNRRYMYGQGSISFWTVTDTFDWISMTDRQANEHVVSLVDHYTIEWRYPLAISMLYRFMEDPGERNIKVEQTMDTVSGSVTGVIL